MFQMCRGEDMVCLLIEGDGHTPITRVWYIHCNDSQYRMDDHSPYTMFWWGHTWMFSQGIGVLWCFAMFCSNTWRLEKTWTSEQAPYPNHMYTIPILFYINMFWQILLDFPICSWLKSHELPLFKTYYIKYLKPYLRILSIIKSHFTLYFTNV